jgi:hypothetical protein
LGERVRDRGSGGKRGGEGERDDSRILQASFKKTSRGAEMTSDNSTDVHCRTCGELHEVLDADLSEWYGLRPVNRHDDTDALLIGKCPRCTQAEMVITQEFPAVEDPSA